METRKALRERVGREQQLMDRLRTATVHFADARIERAWAISSAHQSGLSIRRIASVTDFSPSRVHQLLNAEATDMPAWLSRLRETDEAGPVGSNAEMCSRLATEVKVLRRCIDWLELRLDTDENTEYVPFDHARVMRILGRIASDLEGLAAGRQNPKDEDEPAVRHRRQLAEPQQQPKKLSMREERNALRAKLKLPPQ
jgi:hypothetical protein